MKTRRLAAIAVLPVLALILSSCLNLTATMTVNPDATASGNFEIAMNKELLALGGISDLDGFKQNLESETDSGAFNEACSPTYSETDTEYVMNCQFTDQAFVETDAPWEISKSGDNITFRVYNEALDTNDLPAEFKDAALGEIDITATFPGPVSEVTGGAEKVDDFTVKFGGPVTERIEQTATASATPSSGGGGGGAVLVVVIIIVVLVLIIAGAIIGLLLFLGRKKQAPVQQPYAAPVMPQPPTTQQPTTPLPPTTPQPPSDVPPTQG